MRIRGSSKPECKLCKNAVKDEKGKLFCLVKKETQESKNSCNDFKYDIFKYTPMQKNDFGKFSKEDFEI